MKKVANAVKESKRLAALLVVAVTVIYLGLTAALAQSSLTSTSSGTNLAYEPDYLSFGDMYAFTESVYQSSRYGQTNSTQTESLYNSTEANKKTTANQTFYLYYGKVTTGDHSNVSSDSEKMENHAYTVFNSGCAQGTAPAAVAGETVNVMTTTGTGLYTLVPGTTGTYRIYVYAESNPTGKVKYELIDSYTKANAYTGAPTQSLNFTQVGTTNYWYATISVGELTWSAYKIEAAKSESTASSTTKDTYGGVTYTGKQEGKTTLGSDDYYYNVWTATEIYYNTLLTIQFPSTVQLAPVTKTGDTITINNSNSSVGSLTAVNAFGETVAVGSAANTVHAPIYITATATDSQYAFSGFGDADLGLVNAEQGIYKYSFESTATLTGEWIKKENLPTIKISGAYSGTMDFMAAKNVSTEIVKGTKNDFTLTLDYTNAADVQSVSYTVTVAGTQTASGSLSEASNTISLNAQWDTAVVTLTATSITNKTYTAVFTVNVGTAGLVDVAQIGSTKYQFIEDALAAAVSGNTVTIINAKASFVDSATVPANWTADSNSDGSPDGYTVKSGVTLILPYSTTGSTSIGSSSADYPYALCTMSATVTNSLATSESYEYRKLTVPAGKTMYIKGTVATGGTISSYSGVAGGTNGSASETYSVLELNGTAEVLSGGIVTSCGYIYGSGTLRAASGAKLYQPFVICDFRGGGYTVGAAGKSYAVGTQTGESYVSAFTRFAAQNIQSRVEMSEGALMYGYCDLYTASTGGHNQTTTCLVGSSSVDGLIKLSSGATLTSTYDKDDTVAPYPLVGHTDITLQGGGSFGYLSLTTQGQTIYTNELTFPVPYNFGIHLNGSGSKYTIGYSMVLLPGATLEVGEGATLDVGSSSSSFRFMAMDGYNCHIGPASGDTYTISYGQKKGNNYPTTAVLQAAGKSGSSDLIVNGTLNINSGVNFGGVVQTDSDNAVLNMDSAATPSCAVQMGLVGSKTIIITKYYFAGATTRTLKAQVLDRGTGQKVDIVAGQIYHGSAGAGVLADYTYELYTDASNKSTKETHTDTLNAAIKGSWYNYKGTVVTMDTTNNVEKSRVTAYFCVNSDLDGYYSDAACTTAAQAPSADGFVYYTSTDASAAKIVWADGSAETYYNTLSGAIKDAEHTGDKVVLLKSFTQSSSAAIDKTQNLTIDLGGFTISYKNTPFINQGTVTLDLNGGTITNLVSGAYAAAPAFTNNEGGAATLDLNGGTITVQAPAGQTAQFNAVVNYGTLSVADTAGGGGIYCYGPDGPDGKTVTLTTTLGGNPTVDVQAEIYASTLAAEVIYTGIFNTGTIDSISGGTTHSPMYGIYSGSSAAVSYPQNSYDLAQAKTTVATDACINSISGGTIEGGYVGLMNNGGVIGGITGGTVKTTGAMFVGNGAVAYRALYNVFGAVGDVSNATFLANDSFTLERLAFTFTDGTQGNNTTAKITNSTYGIESYGNVWTDTTISAGYRAFVPTLGDLTGCAINATGTKLLTGTLEGYTGAYTETVNNGNGYALRNYGIVGNITGCTIEGNRGIFNYNLVFAPTVYDTGSSSNYLKSTVTRSVVQEGTIGDIRDSDVTAYHQYALLNYGHVGSLCGNSSFTAYAKITQGYAVMNHSGWYNGTVEQKTVTQRETYTKSDGTTGYRNTKITYDYDGSGTATGLDDAASVWQSISLPTIDSIADSVTITAVNNGTNADWGYALNNGGRIGSIGGGTGTVTIQTYTGDSATVTTSNYALANSGYIDSIGGNVTCTASGQRAISNSGSRYADRVISYTYASAATLKTTDTVINYRVPPYIGSIGSATLSAGGNYGIINYGWIGPLTGTTITTGGSNGIVNQADSNASWSHTLKYETAYSPAGYDAANPGYTEEYTRFGARVGDITNASITAASSYAISNSGEIGNITGGSLKVTASENADGYTLYNSDSYQRGYLLKRYDLGQIDSVNSARYITLEEKAYTYVDGGTHVGEISGVTFENGRRRTVYNAGTIDAIRNSTISAYSYALSNATAYQTRSTFRYLYGTAALGTSQYIGETNLSYTRAPAYIGAISNVTASTATGEYALQNYGTIDEISGSNFASNTYGAFYNGFTTYGYTLHLPETAAKTPAYLDWVELNSAGNGYTFRVYDRTEDYDWGKIGSITNTDMTVKTHNTSNINTLYNAGEIGSITGGTLSGTWSANQNYYTVYNTGNLPQSCRIVMSDITGALPADNISGKYVTQYLRTYTYPTTGTLAPTIGSLDGVTITNSAGYGLYSGGVINSISGGAISARAYAVNNSGGYYTGTRVTVEAFNGATPLSTTNRYFYETATGYTRNQPVIGAIDGAAITTTGTSYGISNGGIIGAITNNTVTSKTERAISNTDRTAVGYVNSVDNGIGNGVAPQFTWDSANSKYVVATTDTDTSYAVGQIDLIGGGNTISGTTNVIYNSGTITAIDNTDAASSALENSTVTASTGVALYNYQGLSTRDTKVSGTTSYVYDSADIGTVKNIKLTGKSYAIQNGEANANYKSLTIAELGEGVEATSSGSHAVYNQTYASIGGTAEDGSATGGITGGIYTASASGKYAVYNNNTSAPIYISDGDFKGGTNTDETLGRAYAIYQPDTTTRQTYPEGMKLTSAGVTRSVTFANGTTVRGYYYLGPETVVAKFVGGAAGEFASLQAAVAAYPTTDMDGTTYIQMTDNSTEADVTIDRNVFLDLNGKTVTLTSGNGTLTINEGCTLHGMDHTTDGYTDTAYGKIIGTVSGSGTVALTYQTPAAADGTFQRYVKFEDTKNSELSFHRYNISVSGYRFEFNLNDKSALYFQGTFSGSGTVKNLLQDIGFQVDVDDTKIWWTEQKQDLSAVTTPKYEIEIALTRTFTPEELKHEYTVYALLDFGGTDPAMSDPKTLSFWTALQQRYNELTAKDEASRTDKEKAELAVLEQLFNGTSNTEQNTVT